MARVWMLPLLFAGCGRIGFDAIPADGSPRVARSTLALDRVLPGAPLTDVPVPITLDASRADLSRLTPDTFRAYIGTTELPVEIESEGPPFVAWVRVPQIADLTTSFTIEYGGAAVPHTAAWDASYAGVWHMAAAGVDSSPNARASQVTAVTAIPGMIGPATSYVPSQMSCVVVPSFETYSFTQATLTGWMYLRPGAAGNYYTIITRQFGDMVTDDFILGCDSGFNSLGAVATDTFGGPTRIGAALSMGAWHQLVFTYDGAQNALYLDGQVTAAGPASGTPITSPRPVFIGCGRNFGTGPIDQSDGDWVDGAVDEVRFETVARSPAQIAYQYAAERDEIITYGPVQ